MSESLPRIVGKPGPKDPHLSHELFGAARDAIQWAVAPSSKFRVGAALATSNDIIFTGCNIESPAYLGMCAERVALFKALSDGAREFTILAIVSEEGVPCLPCGSCRQLLWEFAPELQIIVFQGQKISQIYNLSDLLPKPFDREGHAPFPKV